MRKNNTKKQSKTNVLQRQLDVSPEQFQVGFSQADYLCGFGYALGHNLKLNSEQVATIVLNKMTLEYSQEMLRMRLQTAELLQERSRVEEEVY